MTIDERIKYAEQRKKTAFEKGGLSDLVYWSGYLDAVKAMAEDMHNLEQSRDYWRAKAEKFGKKLHNMRKGTKEV